MINFYYAQFLANTMGPQPGIFQKNTDFILMTNLDTSIFTVDLPGISPQNPPRNSSLPHNFYLHFPLGGG